MATKEGAKGMFYKFSKLLILSVFIIISYAQNSRVQGVIVSSGDGWYVDVRPSRNWPVDCGPPCCDPPSPKSNKSIAALGANVNNLLVLYNNAYNAYGTMSYEPNDVDVQINNVSSLLPLVSKNISLCNSLPLNSDARENYIKILNKIPELLITLKNKQNAFQVAGQNSNRLLVLYNNAYNAYKTMSCKANLVADQMRYLEQTLMPLAQRLENQYKILSSTKYANQHLWIRQISELNVLLRNRMNYLVVGRQ